MKQSAVNRAYTWVRDRIIDGEYAGGTFIDEAAICEGAGVSRTPAREALHRLEGERFIVLEPRRGARVRGVSMEDLHDGFRARIMIETHAAAEFCDRRLDVPAEMSGALSEMEELARRGSFVPTDARYDYHAQDNKFHRALVSTLENELVTDFFDSMWRVNQFAMIKRSTWMLFEDRVSKNLTEHQNIQAALGDHDSERARLIIIEHLATAPGLSALTR